MQIEVCERQKFPLSLITCFHRGVGRGCGVGRGLGVALGVALGVGVTIGVPVGVGLTVAVGVGVGVGVGLAKFSVWTTLSQLPPTLAKPTHQTRVPTLAHALVS